MELLRHKSSCRFNATFHGRDFCSFHAQRSPQDLPTGKSLSQAFDKLQMGTYRSTSQPSTYSLSESGTFAGPSSGMFFDRLGKTLTTIRHLEPPWPSVPAHLKHLSLTISQLQLVPRLIVPGSLKRRLHGTKSPLNHLQHSRLFIHGFVDPPP